MVRGPILRHDESAVSPVVGTILMVAIVVVLAGTLWFIVGQLRADVETEPFPNILFVGSDEANTITVQSFNDWTGGTLHWSNVTGSDDYVVVTGCNDVNGSLLDGTVEVQVGDILHCNPGTITVTHPLSNHLIYTTELH